MNTTAFLLMIITFFIVIAVTFYYLYKAITIESSPIDDGMPEVITKVDVT